MPNEPRSAAARAGWLHPVIGGQPPHLAADRRDRLGDSRAQVPDVGPPELNPPLAGTIGCSPGKFVTLS